MITTEERQQRVEAILDEWKVPPDRRDDWRDFAEAALAAAERAMPALAKSEELIEAEQAARDFARALRRVEDGSASARRLARDALRKHPRFDCW